ncbi:Plasma membrane t-SNARE, secretory vesicle fusion [Apophysomyces sp. BC1034]|nr:Plasma membrane t-SNARE, secretory vesicle fusion [Apophysomyces sp. BC1015]KAG0174344.1 Plasma membrane t-SNARE, secretory vesicle fusion [Apophysomyces sp. BC1021]KAG0185732.1 Plasma membrane t-SNARE, secretory vesicle fusion [Apophysomyces sp. BC1034]
MNVDRLAELSRPDSQSHSISSGQGGGPGRYEMRPLLATQSDPASMDGFLNEISQIQDSIKTINSNVQRIQTAQSGMLQTGDANEVARCRATVENMTDETQRIMTHIKQKLKEIEPNSRNTDLAIRKNQFAAVTKSFMDAIERHRQIAVEFQRAESKQLERQIKIANPDASPDEIEQAISQAEQGRPAVFAQQLMQTMSTEQRRYDAQETLDAVQERHEDIRKLAKSVQELSELFQEMQYLLENQAQVLNTIEASSYEIVSHIEKGEEQIGTAVKFAKATRKKKWICFGIFAVILIVIIIVLVVHFVPRNNQNQQ